MSMAKGTPASSQIIWLEGRVQELEQELAEVKQENLKLSALVVERDYQITLANKGYDYEGAVEDARHYNELAAALREELAEAKRERDKHFVASKAQNEDITSLQTELAAAKEKYFQVCAQHGRLVDQVYEEDGETLKHVAAEAELASYKLWAEVEMADLREDLSDHIRMAKDAQEDAGRYRWLMENAKHTITLSYQNEENERTVIFQIPEATSQAIDAAIKEGK